MTEKLVLDPDKRYFRIGEVSALTGIKPYVLRFWEGEFKQIRPGRTLSGQRVYKRSDLELIFKIKKLLYEQKFTIPGAKAALAQDGGCGGQPETAQALANLEEIRKELLAIRRLMD